jgi:hypothetical protein
MLTGDITLRALAVAQATWSEWSHGMIVWDEIAVPWNGGGGHVRRHPQVQPHALRS